MFFRTTSRHLLGLFPRSMKSLHRKKTKRKTSQTKEIINWGGYFWFTSSRRIQVSLLTEALTLKFSLWKSFSLLSSRIKCQMGIRRRIRIRHSAKYYESLNKATCSHFWRKKCRLCWRRGCRRRLITLRIHWHVYI